MACSAALTNSGDAVKAHAGLGCGAARGANSNFSAVFESGVRFDIAYGFRYEDDVFGIGPEAGHDDSNTR
jgi:hypothetical protein